MTYVQSESKISSPSLDLIPTVGRTAHESGATSKKIIGGKRIYVIGRDQKTNNSLTKLSFVHHKAVLCWQRPHARLSKNIK